MGANIIIFRINQIPTQLLNRATASKNLLPFAYGNAVKTSSLLC